jgi:MerR family mercuric resistance operon transcriptional regulator
MDGQPLRIGALARAAGVGVETIRYYQRRRLLGTPARAFGGQRSYPPDFVDRLRFIKRAQALGFSLADVAALLQLDDGTGHVRARQLAAARLAEIESRIADLAAMREVLAQLIHDCEHAEGRVPCPIIATLLRDDAHAARRPRRPATARPRTSTTARSA